MVVRMNEKIDKYIVPALICQEVGLVVVHNDAANVRRLLESRNVLWQNNTS